MTLSPCIFYVQFVVKFILLFLLYFYFQKYEKKSKINLTKIEHKIRTVSRVASPLLWILEMLRFYWPYCTVNSCEAIWWWHKWNDRNSKMRFFNFLQTVDLDSSSQENLSWTHCAKYNPQASSMLIGETFSKKILDISITSNLLTIILSAWCFIILPDCYIWVFALIC